MAARTSSTSGRMVAVGFAKPITASRVLEPVPGVQNDGLGLRIKRTVPDHLTQIGDTTPPAVSAKMPSVRASSRMPSTTSSSLTAAIDPGAPDHIQGVRAVGPGCRSPATSRSCVRV